MNTLNNLWRFISGYLKIEISAENGEQILNKAATNKIHIWNLRCKNKKITGNISAKNFKKLRTVRHGTYAKIKIIEKCGLIFKTKKYNNRLGFVSGFILFVLSICFLSNYIWIINIEGNEKISNKDIIESCKKIGIKEGMYKGKINNKYDAQRLQLVQDGIAWCSLNVEGSILTVNLSEAEVSDKEERKEPSNIKAAFDGKIKKIDISSGNSVVKVGDVVSKGQLLVSGTNNNLSSTVFVHSEGEVIAETKRIFSAEGRFKQTLTKQSLKTTNRYTVSIFNLKIPIFLGNVNGEYKYIKSTENLKLFNKKIPIKILTEQYVFFEKATVEYNSTELENMLYDEIIKQVNDFNFINFKENNKEIIKTDEGILLKIEFICEENIAIQDKILLNTEN